ncbi:hypothetical protein XMIN_1021 [Xanthomonas citri pv. mangiferaeindicae LMG 941]|nr:hypothetical protein XMIN_1021 [Xanthomonas citri pv. mangiferaeindicae LMG 941]
MKSHRYPNQTLAMPALSRSCSTAVATPTYRWSRFVYSRPNERARRFQSWKKKST